MEKLKKKSLLELKKMELAALEQYYKEIRKFEYDNGVKLTGTEYRKKIHKLCYALVKLDRILSKEGLSIIGDERVESNAPKIFACTHIGGNDIQRTFEAIKDHAYLFLGDPKELYRDITGKLLYLNGVIVCQTDDKEDRHIAYERSLELLGTNTNLLIYPEGAWNISRNKPVMHLYPGVAKMAKETGADIVPVAIEQYGSDFFVNIGKNIPYKSNYSDHIDDVSTDLRDKMATLKYQIWEKRGIHHRSEITQEELENFEVDICEKCGYDFSVQDVLDTMYNDQDIRKVAEEHKTRKLVLSK